MIEMHKIHAIYEINEARMELNGRRKEEEGGRN
jgi:hypothetical protein